MWPSDREAVRCGHEMTLRPHDRWTWPGKRRCSRGVRVPRPVRFGGDICLYLRPRPLSAPDRREEPDGDAVVRVVAQDEAMQHKLGESFIQFLWRDLKFGRDPRLIDRVPGIPSKKARQQQKKPKLRRIPESPGDLARLAVDHDMKSQVLWLARAHDDDLASALFASAD